MDYKKIDGVASLPTVVALAGLILVIGLGMAAISFSENIIAASSWNSSKAFSYAESGAYDALEKIVRNKKYSAVSAYQIEFVSNGCTTNDGCAIITVDTASDPKIITSEGHAGNVTRKLQVSVTFDDSSNGQINTASWQELSN
jgi:Tfp pilus assembly protein PilX